MPGAQPVPHTIDCSAAGRVVCPLPTARSGAARRDADTGLSTASGARRKLGLQSLLRPPLSDQDVGTIRVSRSQAAQEGPLVEPGDRPSRSDHQPAEPRHRRSGMRPGCAFPTSLRIADIEVSACCACPARKDPSPACYTTCAATQRLPAAPLPSSRPPRHQCLGLRQSRGAPRSPASRYPRIPCATFRPHLLAAAPICAPTIAARHASTGAPFRPRPRRHHRGHWKSAHVRELPPATGAVHIRPLPTPCGVARAFRRAIPACRTAPAATSACDGCGEVSVSNSCRSHCPKCQAQQRANWLPLPSCSEVPYFDASSSAGRASPLALQNVRSSWGED